MKVSELCKAVENLKKSYILCLGVCLNSNNRSFSYSKKESGSNDISSHFVEFSNVYNGNRSSNATQSNLVYKMYENNARSRLFRRIAKRSILKTIDLVDSEFVFD